MNDVLGPRSSSRSNNSVTGSVSSLPPRVSTSSASSTLSTMMLRRMMSKLSILGLMSDGGGEAI